MRNKIGLLALAALPFAASVAFACSSPSELDDEYDDEHEYDDDEHDGEYGRWLAKDQTLDRTRAGLRLVLRYHDSDAEFAGTVENVGNRQRRQIEVEVYLDNGGELETRYFDLAPGQTRNVRLATRRSFDRWRAYVDID